MKPHQQKAKPMDKPSAEAMRIAKQVTEDCMVFDLSEEDYQIKLAAEIDAAIQNGIIAFLEGFLKECNAENIADAISKTCIPYMRRGHHSVLSNPMECSHAAIAALIELAKGQKNDAE